MELNNTETYKHIVLVKNNYENIFKKTEPTLTPEQLNNRVNEVAREILLDKTKKA